MLKVLSIRLRERNATGQRFDQGFSISGEVIMKCAEMRIAEEQAYAT